MSTTPTAVPIACTLTAGDFRERLAWIAALNRDALRSHRRRGRTLELCYAPDAIERVRELVRRERHCCAFLEFDLREEPDAVRLTITAPEATRSIVAAVLGYLFSRGRRRG